MVVFAPKALALTSRWNQNLRLNMLTASALRYFFRKGAQSHLTLCAPKSLLSIHCPPLVQVFLGPCLLLLLLPLLFLLLFPFLLSSCHSVWCLAEQCTGRQACSENTSGWYWGLRLIVLCLALLLGPRDHTASLFERHWWLISDACTLLSAMPCQYNKNIHHLAKPCKRYQISLISTASLTRCVLRTMTFHILADMATSEILLKSKMKRNNNLTFIDFPKMGNEVIFQSLLYWCLHLWPWGGTGAAGRYRSGRG